METYQEPTSTQVVIGIILFCKKASVFLQSPAILNQTGVGHSLPVGVDDLEFSAI